MCRKVKRAGAVTPTAHSRSTPLPARKRTKTSKRLGLRHEMELLFDALNGSLAILAGVNKEKEKDKAIDKRLTRIEARIEEGQVELKSISNKMLALLEDIAQKQ
jgi:hypothetical protein